MKIQECFYELRQEDDERKSIAQHILQKSTDFPRRIKAPVGRQGGVTLSYVCPRCHHFQIEHRTWWVSTRHRKRQCNWWCAACGGQHDWTNPNRVLAVQDSMNPSEAKVFRAHAPPNGVCENRVCALKFLAHQQLGGDSPVQVPVEGSPRTEAE